MPILHNKDIADRLIVLPDAKGFKNPDLRIDGELCEVESPLGTGRHTLKHSISDAGKQANYVLINLHGWRHINELRGPAKSKFIDYKHLKIVEYRINGIYVPFSRHSFVFGLKEPLL